MSNVIPLIHWSKIPLKATMIRLFSACVNLAFTSRSADPAVDMGFYHPGLARLQFKRKFRVNMLSSATQSDDMLSASGGGA